MSRVPRESDPSSAFGGRVARRRSNFILLAGLAFIALGAPFEARAAGLFDFLFGSPSPPPPPPMVQRYSPGPAYYPSPHSFRHKPTFAVMGKAKAKSKASAGVSSAHAFCVRSCDGYFFPITWSDKSDGEKVCGMACPGAPVSVFRGSHIEDSRDGSGQRYDNLSVAFQYRDKRVASCTCESARTSGAAVGEALADPTLRSGDIVMTSYQAMVYSGGSVTKSGAPFSPIGASHHANSNTKRLARILLEAKRSLTAALPEMPAAAIPHELVIRGPANKEPQPAVAASVETQTNPARQVMPWASPQ